MNKILECIAKKYVLYYFQVKIKHNVEKTYLAKIKVIKTSQFWCGYTK